MRDTPLTIMSMMGEEVIPITVTTNLHHGKGLMHSHTFFEFVYIDHVHCIGGRLVFDSAQ